MAKVLTVVNGIPTIRTQTADVSIEDFSETLASDISSPTEYTLPGGLSYDGQELEIWVNNIRQDEGIDFFYVGAGSAKTKIYFSYDLFSGWVVRARIDRLAETDSAVYDETVEVVASSPGAGEIIAVSSGTAITLPSGGSYESAELEIYLNGIRQVVVEDFNYVGSEPRSQVSLTQDLAVGDLLRFRVDRSGP
jgi:hypothetical protein